MSKIEQGKAQPSDEVTGLLLARLGVQWHTGETEKDARRLADALYDAFWAMDNDRAEQLCIEPDDNIDYVNTKSILDLLLLQGLKA